MAAGWDHGLASPPSGLSVGSRLPQPLCLCPPLGVGGLDCRLLGAPPSQSDTGLRQSPGMHTQMRGSAEGPGLGACPQSLLPICGRGAGGVRTDRGQGRASWRVRPAR